MDEGCHNSISCFENFCHGLLGNGLPAFRRCVPPPPPPPPPPVRWVNRSKAVEPPQGLQHCQERAWVGDVLVGIKRSGLMGRGGKVRRWCGAVAA